MGRAENVLQYYVLCNKLKDVIRTGWKNWNVDRDRVESVAEHVYGTLQLAFAMWSEYHCNVDIMKVAMMLAVHELEETVIGDLTMFDISREEKEKIGHKAVEEILSGLSMGESIKSLILEFDERETDEAYFAYMCDKLECDIQSKLYDEEGCVDLKNQEGNISLNDSSVQELLGQGKSFSDMWLEFGRNRYPYDMNFREVSNAAQKMSLKPMKQLKIKK